MRVLHLTDDMSTGGLQQVVVLLANGHSADFAFSVGVAASPGGQLWGALDAGVERLHLPGDRSVLGRSRNAIWLARVIWSGNWDVIHAHQRGVALLARILSLLSVVSVVEHVHNTFKRTVMTNILSFRSDRLIACGSTIRRMLLEEFRRDERKVTLVLNAVPDVESRFRTPVPSLQSKTVRILGIGRMSAQKDPLKFVAIIRELRKSLPEVSAEWVGGGELYTEFQSAIDESGLSQVISAFGHSDDVARKLSESDVLLITSRWEGLPLVALEALACERGIVAPGVGSMSDVVKSANGILYDPGSSAAQIAAKVKEGIQCGNIARWGPSSRKLFEDMATVQAMLSAVESVYMDAQGSGRHVERG